MSPKPSPTAIALAASLTSLSASASASAQERGTDPLSAPPRPLSTKQKQKAQKQTARQQAHSERGELPSVDWLVEPFAFLGGDMSWVTTNFSYYPLPRIAPHFGAGLRFNQAGEFSVQTELALDFVGGTNYFYGLYWYTYAATYLSLPLLARHRIQNQPSKRKHFTWGLQIAQRVGQSYHLNILGVPVSVYSGGGTGYYGYYGYSGAYNLFANRVLSAAIGYQSRKTTRKGRIFEFEMRLNAGVARLGDDEGELVSNFMLRWNIVPRKKR